MKNIVEIKNFQMKFGNKTVIKDLSFEIKAGEIFGLLGALLYFGYYYRTYSII